MEISYEHALKIANDFYNQKEYCQAAALLDQLLSINPNHPAVLFLRGVVALEQDDLAQALPKLHAATQANPNQSYYKAVFALSLYKAGMFQEALHEAVSSIIGPETSSDPLAFNVLQHVISHFPISNPPVEEAKRLVEGLGEAPAQRIGEIIGGFQPPPNPAELCVTQANAALFLHCGGADEAAVEMMSLAGKPFAISPKTEIDTDYSQLAQNYDENALHLSCNHVMMEFIASYLPDQVDTILDACCGTGLMGTELRGRTKYLAGFDLSQSMLDIAISRNVYDRLILADARDDAAIPAGPFDAVISTDALYHLPDLAPVMRTCAKRLHSGGLLAFSTEAAADRDDRICSAVGGYGHSRAYLSRIASESGFEPLAIELLPHRRYPGFYAAFRKICPRN